MDDLTFFTSVTTFLILIVSGIVCGAAGYYILDRVDRGGLGIALGFFLGPVGLVIAWVLRDSALRDEEMRRQVRVSFPAEAPVGFGRRTSSQQATLARSPGSLASDVEALERLALLKERGYITQDEFDIKKRQVLGFEPPSSPKPGSPPLGRRFR